MARSQAAAMPPPPPDAEAAAPAPAPEPEPPRDDLLRSVGSSEWRVAWSQDRARPFYHNITTGRSQWTPPMQAWT